MLNTFYSHLLSIEVEKTAKTPNPYMVKNYDTNNWPSQGKIEFVNYSVKYRPNLPLVLKNLIITF